MCLKGDKGDLAMEMYFLRSGRVEVRVCGVCCSFLLSLADPTTEPLCLYCRFQCFCRIADSYFEAANGRLRVKVRLAIFQRIFVLAKLPY